MSAHPATEQRTPAIAVTAADDGHSAELDKPCGASPAGTCRLTWRDNWRACVHCHEPVEAPQ